MGRLLSDIAYGRIRKDIIRCALPPAAAITESRLAGRYRLGKAPIRAALARLAHEGLVHAVPRRGYQVARVTIRDLQSVFQMRRILEPAAARLAAGRVDTARLRRLDALCQAGYTPRDRASEDTFLRANRELHVTIARASGNDRLASAVEQLLEEMERVLHVGLAIRDRTIEMQHEHRALVDALAAGDGAAAERIAGEQIDAAYRMVLDGALSSPGLLDADLVPA